MKVDVIRKGMVEEVHGYERCCVSVLSLSGYAFATSSLLGRRISGKGM